MPASSQCPHSELGGCERDDDFVELFQIVIPGDFFAVGEIGKGLQRCQFTAALFL
jgi:hypothetical protein